MPSVIKMRNYVNGIQCQAHERTYSHISLLENTLFSKTIWFKATYGPEMGGDVCNWTQGDSFAKTNFFIPRKKWCQKKILRSPARVSAEKRKSYNSLQIIVFHFLFVLDFSIESGRFNELQWHKITYYRMCIFWPPHIPHINLDDPPSLFQHTADQARPVT